MKVSIITATYNSAETLKDNLISVQSQTYPNIEHIIIDGCSTDNTLQIVNEYSHISKIFKEEDRGIYYAMNKGIEVATGDIIGILNSDDYYADVNAISDVVQQFETTGCDALYADLIYFNPEKNYKVVRKWKSGSYNREKFLKGWMPPHPTVFIRKSAYEQYGVFNTEFKSAADYELLLRLLYIHKIKTTYLERTLVYMRSGGMSNKSLKNRIKAHLEDYRAWSYNMIHPRWYTIILKPLRKIWQYF